VRPRCVVWLCAGPLLLEVLLQASRRKCGCPGVPRACASLTSLAVRGTALHGVEARWRLTASCLPRTAPLPHVPTAPRPRPRPRPRLAPLRLRLPWPLRLQEGECRPRVCARQVLCVGVEDTCLPCGGAPDHATMPPSPAVVAHGCTHPQTSPHPRPNTVPLPQVKARDAYTVTPHPNVACRAPSS
jgi:hypothetical protein